MERVSGTWAAVQAVGDRVEFVLTVEREVGAFRQILAQQSTQVKKWRSFSKVFASWICGVSSGVSVALRFLVDDGRYGER